MNCERNRAIIQRINWQTRLMTFDTFSHNEPHSHLKYKRIVRFSNKYCFSLSIFHMVSNRTVINHKHYLKVLSYEKQKYTNARFVIRHIQKYYLKLNVFMTNRTLARQSTLASQKINSNFLGNRHAHIYYTHLHMVNISSSD